MSSDHVGANFVDLLGVTAKLEAENARLRQKNRNQKLELRRLNTAHVMKNARVVNVEHEIVQLQKKLAEAMTDNVALIETVRAFMMGDIEVVRPFKQVPMPAGGAPDLMSMVKDLTPLLPGNQPE